MASPNLSAETSAPPPRYSTQNHDRCIVHFDIDCFYAQVEEVLNPSLRGKPIGIRQKYLLVTCNYTARSLGVRKMKSVAEAKRRCPSLIIMDGEDLTRYREASEAIFSYVAGVCGPMVQRLGMDEIFADVTRLIRSRGHAKGDGSGPGTGDNDGAVGITGHLFSPGSGGTLLEAQTGVQISLDAGGSSSAGGVDVGEAFEADNWDISRMSPDGAGEESPAKVPLTNTAGSLEDEQERRFAREIDHSSNRDSVVGVDNGTAGHDCPVKMRTCGVRFGSGSPSVGEGFQEKDNSRIGGIQASAALGVEKAGKGRCRCGCFERLCATSAFAEGVRKGLHEVVGYTCSAGIGCSKMAAKLAGELHKPAQQTTILPEHVVSMVTQLPLRKLPGCGYSTCAKIKTELGIMESRQLQAAPWPLLVRAVGPKVAKVLFLLCRGEDDTPVVPSVRPKTMSDEDSFKRGTVRSRHQVEHHVRRLAAPLLLRTGERVRLHKEAPETLRLAFRRASKGYGVRVSRQCAVSSGVAAAWAAVASGATAGREENAKAEPTGLADTGVSVGLKGSPATAKITQAPFEQQQQHLPQQDLEGHEGEAERALSEVIRLVMVMFDKMVSPREALDLTLLSVGFATFRGLRGGAQSGMTRYLEASPQSGDGNEGRQTTLSPGRRLQSEGSSNMPAPRTSRPELNSNQGSMNVTGSSASHIESPSATSRLTVAAANPAAPGEGMAASPDAVGKRRRPPENPYQPRREEREPQRHCPHLDAEEMDLASGKEYGSNSHTARDSPVGEHKYSAEWEGAEVLVVGEGGKEVHGWGPLDWCGVCGVHVLREDLEGHHSSCFHRNRLRMRIAE